MNFTMVLIILLILLALRVPIWVALLASSLPYFIINQVPLSVIPLTMSAGTITSFILLGFPLFSLAGKLMNNGGITERIFDWANVHFGWIRGGLGHVNIVASVIFAGMSGSAIADIGGLGSIEIDGMTKRGFDLEFSTAITLASSTIGPIIPPSTPLIIYAVIANQSVAALFLGGIIPGLLMGISLMVMVYLFAVKRKYPVEPFPKFKQSIMSTLRVILPTFNIIIILGGMAFGIFTPTEAAAVSVAYSIVLGMVGYKELTWKRLWSEIVATAKFCASVYVIIGASMVFTFIITREQIGNQLVAVIESTGLGATPVLFLFTLLVLVLGCLIDVTALIILILPVIVPVLIALDINLVHYGVVFIMTGVLGILTPPFGLGLYAASGMTGLPFIKVVRSVTPFLIPLMVTIILVILIPDLVLFIPNLFSQF